MKHSGSKLKGLFFVCAQFGLVSKTEKVMICPVPATLSRAKTPVLSAN